MRLEEKKLILGLLDTIHEATVYIEEVGIKSGERVLLDCVEALQAIENQLKKEEGIIEIIDLYKELVLSFSELLTNGIGVLDKNIEEVKRRIINLKHTINQEIKCKLKVLFLPYKVAMWTALESVWKAAHDDPNCEATVMPIPYFELDYMNQELVHRYEGEEYPKYVPVVHYNEYNIEEEKPDVIFIHNPYDDTNTITSVEPKYYSRNLKKHTQMLVYIPYFIFGPINTTVEIPNHMHLSAIEHVDKFIVQSERVKELYEKYNSNHREKFIALGSPKTDAVIENIKQAVAIPSEWKEKAKGKKVFLYNIHISIIPKLKESAIRRMKFGTKEITSRKNCVLLWRVHPLMEIMLKNYCPEYLEQYRGLKSDLSKMKNVIIDENASYLPAFTLSDAMISTRSSLIREYMLTEKPILIIGKKFDKKTFENSPVDMNCNYFSIGENNELKFLEFLDMVVQEKDLLKSSRVNTIKKSLLNCDGTCGMKVFEYIKKEVIER